MKHFMLIAAVALPLFCSCDTIDAVGDRVDELKDAREVSTNGVEGMDLKAITDGIRKSSPAVQDIGEVDFQEFISEPGMLNIVDFHADWCGPCKKLAPVLSGVVEENSHVARLGKLNVDQARELAQEQGVRSIPDVRFYIDGKLVDKFTGGVSKEAIERIVATRSTAIKPVARLGEGITEADGTTGTALERPRPANAKPIGEAMKPMDDGWLPPGVIRK